MGRLFWFFSFASTLCFGTILVGWLINYAFGDPRAEVKSFVDNFWPLLVIGSTLLLGFTYWSWIDKRRRDFESEWKLFKPAHLLEPSDFGQRLVQKGDELGINDEGRPLYPLYIPRRLVRLDDRRDGYGTQPIYPNAKTISQNEFMVMLKGNDQRGGPNRDGILHRFALVGEPLEGKSTFAYHLFKEMKGWIVVTPDKEKTSPSEDAIAYLEGKEVVLFLDDLNEFVGYNLDLDKLYKNLEKYSRSLVLATLCRSGPELKLVSNSLDTPLQRFYSGIPEFALVPPTEAEKQNLSEEGMGKVWDAAQSVTFPNLGSITLQRKFRDMQDRYNALTKSEQLILGYKDVLDALRLLSDAGLRPYTVERLKRVLDRLYPRPGVLLRDCLAELKDQDFLNPSSDEGIVQPEPAYLEYVVPPALPEKLSQLQQALATDQDINGLLLLGYSHLQAGRLQEAQACFEQITRIKPNSPEAWSNWGVALSRLADLSPDPQEQKRLREEAVGKYRRATDHKPDFHEAWSNWGVALSRLADLSPDPQEQKRLREEKMGKYRRAARYKLNPTYIHNLGVSYVQLGRTLDALRAFAEMLKLGPNWYLRTVELFKYALVNDPDEKSMHYCYAWGLRKQFPLLEKALYDMLFVDLEFDRLACGGYQTPGPPSD